MKAKNELKKTSEGFLEASRFSKILPKFVGLSFAVHNGRTLESVEVGNAMVGHKFGEFFFTRAPHVFKKKKKKKK